MIMGIRTYVYKPLEVARAESSRLHVQSPRGNTCRLPSLQKRVEKEKLEGTARGVSSNFLFLFLYFRIHNIYVTICINQNIARKNVVALLRSGLHLLGYFQVALHVLRKVARAHWRLLRCGYFPHLALRHFLVELVQKCHCSSCFCLCKDKKYLANDVHCELKIMFFCIPAIYSRISACMNSLSFRRP